MLYLFDYVIILIYNVRMNIFESPIEVHLYKLWFYLYTNLINSTPYNHSHRSYFTLVDYFLCFRFTNFRVLGLTTSLPTYLFVGGVVVSVCRCSYTVGKEKERLKRF